MASSSLKGERQERMRVMSLDYLKNTLARKPSPKRACCNDELCLNLQEPTRNVACDTVAVNFNSGSCNKCGKTKLRNKSGLFKFLRKWLWWQNNLGTDNAYKCNSENNNAKKDCVNSSLSLTAPSDSESKENIRFSECVNRSNVDITSDTYGSDESTEKSLDIAKLTNNCLDSNILLLDNVSLNMGSNNCEMDCADSINSDINNTVNHDNDINHDKETVSDTINAQLVPTSVTGSLTCQLLKLSKFGWYWGPASREEAEEKLENQPDGAFLVRDSSASNYLLSLSFRSSGKILHARIEHNQGLFSFYNQPEKGGFATVVELIDHSVSLSQSAVFCYCRPRSPGHPAFPVRLTKPVSRFTQVKSLQYLCRFVIRQYVTIDNIENLPLPIVLKKYVEESYY